MTAVVNKLAANLTNQVHSPSLFTQIVRYTRSIAKASRDPTAVALEDLIKKKIEADVRGEILDLEKLLLE